MAKTIGRHRKPTQPAHVGRRVAAGATLAAVASFPMGALTDARADVPTEPETSPSDVEEPVLEEATPVEQPAPFEITVAYAVLPGDTLSAIADPTCVTWPELYSANVAVIGDNPDLIFPDQVLTIPCDVAVAPAAVEETAPPAEASDVSTSGFTSPAPGTFLSSEFGPRSTDLDSDGFHDGVDLAGSYGTPIFAAAGGTVIDSGAARGYGNWIRIEAADGVVYTYGHMSSEDLFVGVGRVVAAGELISAIGSEGQSTGPHLHFQIEIASGMTVNPVTFMADRGVAL